MSRPLCILIDGYSLIYRQYYAFQKANFSNSDGLPTNAIYGVVRMILDLLGSEPQYIGVALDRGLSGREQIFPAYKAQRPEMPPELQVQLEHIEAFFRLMNIPILALDDMEADDIIGTLAHQAESAGCEILIFTGDRDLLQLITPHIKIKMPVSGKEKYKIWDEALFAQSYEGLRPLQLIEIKALMGDNSDNIPGVAGVGEKTALSLIKDFGDVASLYQRLDEVKPAFRKKLEGQSETAFLSHQLVTIKCDLPIPLDLEDLKLSLFDLPVLHDFFDRYDFGDTVRQHLKEVASKLGMDVPPEPEADQPQLDYPEGFREVKTDSELADFLQTFSPFPQLMVNVLVQPETFALEGIFLGNESQQIAYFPLNIEAPTQTQQMSLFASAPSVLTIETVLAALKPWLTDPSLPKVSYNAGDFWAIFALSGIEIAPLAADFRVAKEILTQYADTLLTQFTQSYPKNSLSYQLLFGSPPPQIQDKNLWVAHQTLAALAAMPLMQSLLASPNSKAKTLYEEVEMPLVRVLGKMEAAGLQVDSDYLLGLAAEFAQKVKQIEESIYALVGQVFLVTSSKELSRILFEHLNYSPVGLTRSSKTGNYQLPADALESLAEKYDDELFHLLLEHRQMNKLYTGYVKPLPQLINPVTGRLHTHLDQFGAITGRLSSRKPNLQNIPTRSAEGQAIRRAFIAPAGKRLLSADYSQIELRVLAHISGDERLQEAFLRGEDIHQAVAARLFQVEVDEVTSEQRRLAKIVNFGVLYGMGSYRLTRETGMTLRDSGQFIKTFFSTFPDVQNYVENTKQFVRDYGYVATLFGRRRYFPSLLPEKIAHIRAVDVTRLEREAVNTPIQGTAADLIKLATTRLDQALSGWDAQILLQIHDELLLEVAESDVEGLAAVVEAEMNAVGAAHLSVPLVTSVRSGQTWADMTAI